MYARENGIAGDLSPRQVQSAKSDHPFKGSSGMGTDIQQKILEITPAYGALGTTTYLFAI